MDYQDQAKKALGFRRTFKNCSHCGRLIAIYTDENGDIQEEAHSCKLDYREKEQERENGEKVG